MWGQLSSAAGQFKRTINAVASEIKDAVEEARSLDEDPYPQARHPGQEVPQTVSAPSSTRGARASSTSSRLEAIKARLEAERTGSSSSRLSPGVSQEVPPVPSYGRVQHQSHQSAQRPVLGASPFNPGPASTPAANWASASVWNPGTAQAGAAPEQKSPPQHAQAGLWQQKDGGQHGTSHAPSWNAAPARHIPADKGNSTSLPTSPGQRGGAEDAEKLRSHVQHLKAELVATAAAHEEEETRLGQSYEQRIQAAEARNAKLAQLLEKSRASNDSHARIMELQVRLKEEQSEKARLLDQLAVNQPSSTPFSSAAQQPEADEEAFWEQAAAAADGGPSAKREASSSGAGIDGQIAVLQQQLEQSTAEANEQLSSERAAHEATNAALELHSQQGRELEGQLRSAEAALRSEQSAISDLRAELTQTQTLHAELQQRLALHGAAEQHSDETTSQALQAQVQVQGLQAEIAQLKAASADTARQQQASEVAQAVHTAAVSELEAERARRTESENAVRPLQLRTDEAAQALAAEQASHAETHRRLSELELALDKAQTASASHEGAAAQLAAALADLEKEQRVHSQAQLEILRLSKQAAESAEARAAAEETLQALEASHDAQALPAELEQLHAELRQALQSAAQQGERAVKAEDELRGCMRDKEALASSVAELESRCRQLQGELEVVTQQLHQTEQDSKALMSAQLAEVEAAWKDALEDSQQKLQDALHKIADLERQTQDQQPTSSPGSLLQGSNGHSMKTNLIFSEAHADASGLKEKLAETEMELERTKQQLQRLKQATVMRQEDEEDSVRWRVEAEVRLAVDRAQQAAAQQEAQMHKDMADLNAELAHAQEQLDSQSSDLSAWRDAVAAKDLEIQNLQAVLGELAYKSETAERLRLDLRGQAAKLREAEERCQSIQQALEASEASQQALEQKLKAAGEQLEKQRGLETRLMDEAAMLRRALSQSMQQLKLANSDAGAMVDRRIVTKLLLTWVERGRSDQSVLNLMASMLGFTDEEKKRFGIAQSPGLIKAVAGAPIALIKGLATSGDGKGRDGLADQWVEFLIEQANAAEAVQTPGPSRSTSIDQGDRQLV